MNLKLRELADGILNMDTVKISKGISLVENAFAKEESKELIKQIYSHTGSAHLIGITGPPGCGKSTLIGALSEQISKLGYKVAILAIDASSPYTGGSILGNRIRMQESLDKYGIYMRSMASRGMRGGLTRSIWDATKILDAAGFDYIIIETVGAGQSDFEIMNLADTTVVVLAPGLGDEIQAIKAGLMEIGDIFVVNKAELEGAMIAIKDIQNSLILLPQKGWKKVVLPTVARQKQGIEDLFREIEKHKKFTVSDAIKAERELNFAIEELIREKVERILQSKDLNRYLDELSTKKADPYTIAKKVVDG